MSWRTGAELFADIWPLVHDRLRDRRVRAEFTADLLRVFIDRDVDPVDLANLHPEVRAALSAIGVEMQAEDDTDGEEAVAGCIRCLGDADAKVRASSAEALRHFVPEADDPMRASAAIIALAGVLSDPAPKVRREAALSIRVLVRSGFVIPPQARKKLKAASLHVDDVVAKRVKEALDIAGK